MNGKYELHIRFVERPLSERSLTPQIQAIIDDKSLCHIKISDIAIEMLTAIVGRGMTPSLRRVVAESLRETMDGIIPITDQSPNNLLTEVYGEIIGPLMTCLTRGGDFEVIRLERQEGADLLLWDKQNMRVILQECKGTFADYVRTKKNTFFLDVCQQLRNQRNIGKQQLQWPNPDEIGSRKIFVRGIHSSEDYPIPCAEKTVVVTAVPDGRLRNCSSQINPPSHEPCEENCVKNCLFSPDPALICVLSSEKDNKAGFLDNNNLDFLDRYITCERTIWGSAHGSVGETFASLLSSVSQIKQPILSTPYGISLLTSLIERAIERNVYVDFEPIFKVCNSIQQSALIQEIHILHGLQGDVPRPKVTDVNFQEFIKMFYYNEDDLYGKQIKGNWRFQVSAPNSKSDGTLVETCIKDTQNGKLEMLIVPRQVSHLKSFEDLTWCFAKVLAADIFPPEEIYELFVEETATMQSLETNKGDEKNRSLFLGKSLLYNPFNWPIWFPIFNKNVLNKMHSCCPECDMIADWIKNCLPYPPHRLHWRHWKQHHIHRNLLSFGEPLAFVTKDARGYLILTNNMLL